MDQMTIFEVIPVAETDFRDLTEEEIVRAIENSTGLVFKYNKILGNGFYEAIVGTKEYEVHLSRYTQTNEPFISCSYWNKKILGGCSVPCDSLSDAIEFFKIRKHRCINETDNDI